MTGEVIYLVILKHVSLKPFLIFEFKFNEKSLEFVAILKHYAGGTIFMK